MHGTPELPDLLHRVRLCWSANPGESRRDLVDRIARAFTRLGTRVDAKLVRSAGSVGCLPGDGYTHYFDVGTPERFAWTYVGTDYGHPLEIELVTADAGEMPAWLELVQAELAPDLITRVEPGRMADRARG